jgi:hypothetical protein
MIGFASKIEELTSYYEDALAHMNRRAFALIEEKAPRHDEHKESAVEDATEPTPRTKKVSINEEPVEDITAGHLEELVKSESEGVTVYS